ncbi:MAG: gamma-glutamyl-gamma-aminobutyrate hydrolase family protein [Clostridia bacterium]|nr:gamma-glutamyl-gamma-aminobutyrate hydrolase family protein [Clostridia bacterium]
MKAKIGITPTYDNYLGSTKLTPFYAQAIERSGGVPYIIPISRDVSVIKECVDSLDGILFSGGTNIDPLKYGESVDEKCGHIEFERDIFELTLCKYATETNKSILGICRGCQLITVSAGGTLYQHIEQHSQSTDRYIPSHTVEIMKDSFLYNILKTEKIDVNSFHHQSVKTTGELKVAAKCEDVIEAVYHPSQKFHLGIQWHPERMYSTDIHAKMLFDSFIASCS